MAQPGRSSPARSPILPRWRRLRDKNAECVKYPTTMASRSAAVLRELARRGVTNARRAGFNLNGSLVRRRIDEMLVYLAPMLVAKRRDDASAALSDLAQARRLVFRRSRRSVATTHRRALGLIAACSPASSRRPDASSGG